ncbi:hypothetical protein AS889_11140 [Pseudomonas putida]|nr:hypothetical protein AS889_11140 [Pseudomonas putida]
MKLLLAVVILRRSQIDLRHLAKSRAVTAYVTSFLVTGRIKELTAEQKPLTVRREGRFAKAHLDKALGRSLWLEKAEMYPQKYPSIPPAGCAMENGDF